MQAIILAGGKGRQIRSVDSNVPKPLLPLFGRPLIEHSIKLLAKHGITDIHIAASEAAQDMMVYLGDGSHWGVNIHYSVESEPLGTAGAVKLIQNQLKDTFIVLSGDVITDVDLTSALKQHKASGTIASIIVSSVDDPTDYGMVEMDSQGRLTRILEKPRYSEATSTTVSTGIYILEPEAITSIPYHQVCDFALDAFPRMINNLDPVMGIEANGYWCDSGNLRNYQIAHFDALTGKLKLEMPVKQVAGGIWVGEGVKVHSSAQLTGPLFLGDGVVIDRNAVVGENSVIGEGTTVCEGSRISRSIIGSGSMICADSEITNSLVEGEFTLAEQDMLRNRTILSQARYTSPRPATTTIRIPRPKPSTLDTELNADTVNEQSSSVIR